MSVLNEYVGVEILKAADIGGSMFVHTFGAYFGLAVSFVVYKSQVENSPKEETSKLSDLFAMIGKFGQCPTPRTYSMGAWQAGNVMKTQ